MNKITTDQFLELYKGLPEELKEALFNEKADALLDEICQKNGFSESQRVGAAAAAGRVLMGLLPPDEFKGFLEKELKIAPEAAKRAAREIYRYIFYPARAALEEIYKVELAKPLKPVFGPAAEMGGKAEVFPAEKEKAEEPPEKQEKRDPERQGPDIYREPIE